MKTVIVTGGAGFVGSNLVCRLQRDHPAARLVVIDDFRTGVFSNLVPSDGCQGCFQGELIARPLGDLNLADLVEQLKPDVIFHEASITYTTVTDQAKMIADNVEPFAALVDAAVQTGCRLVWASSAATYGQEANGATSAKRPFQIGDAGRPSNVYGFSKWVMENVHRRALSEHPRAHLVGLRYFNVFGPGEQNKGHMASMVYRLAMQMLSGARPRIFVDGEQARDQVFVDDVVDATLAGAADRATSGIYNVGSGQATTFNQIIDALNEALGTQAPTDYFENPYPFYQDYTCADLSHTVAGLGWRPTRDIHQAIVAYAQKLKQHHVSNGFEPKPV